MLSFAKLFLLINVCGGMIMQPSLYSFVKCNNNIRKINNSMKINLHNHKTNFLIYIYFYLFKNIFLEVFCHFFSQV